MRREELAESTCAIAQSLAVVGDPWSLLVIRDVAGGVHRFDALRDALDVSRRTLTDRLAGLVDNGVLERRCYQQRPPRYEYHLTDQGRGLLPTLVALQDWGSRHLLGDGTLSATTTPGSLESERVHGLLGQQMPAVRLLDTAGVGTDPVTADAFTVLACLPGAIADATAYPADWAQIPGAAGCTLEATTYRDLAHEFAALGAHVRLLSTATPRQLSAFAAELDLAMPLLSDEELQLVTALRLPTFHASGRDHLKRLTMIIGPDRMIQAVQFPISSPADSVRETLASLARLG